VEDEVAAVPDHLVRHRVRLVDRATRGVELEYDVANAVTPGVADHRRERVGEDVLAELAAKRDHEVEVVVRVECVAA